VFKRLLVRLFWLVPLLFYVLTASRTPGWVDAPLIAKVVHRLELSIWVNNHNLFTLLGGGWLRIMPRSVDPHYALNLLCALLGALTVYVVFLIGLRVTHNVYASVLGAIVLMVSHSLWWHSAMLEVYTLSTVLLTTTVLFVIRYEQQGKLANLCLASFTFGLACSNHVQMGLLGFGFLGLLLWPDTRRRVLRPRLLLLLAACFFMGFQIYLWVFASELIEHLESASEGETLGVILRAMVDQTSGGDFKQYMFPAGLSAGERLFWWAFYLGFFLYNFPPPWILLAPVGAMAWLQKKDLRASLAFFSLAFGAQLVWSANYFVWDMYAFALPAYVMTGILIILGVDWVYRRSVALRTLVYSLTPTVLLIPVLYGEAPGWIAQSDRADAFLARIPQYEQATAFWDPLDYFFNPNKRSYDHVQRYSTTILTQLDRGACYWGNEATMFYPLKYYYQDVLGERSDVSYHLVFGIVENEVHFEYHAAQLVRHLRRGCPVYISSLGYPERNVLDQVYIQLSGRGSLTEIESLSQSMFMETFPDYRFHPLVVDESEGVRIYKLEER
jgi:hypothetical protein